MARKRPTGWPAAVSRRMRQVCMASVWPPCDQNHTPAELLQQKVARDEEIRQDTERHDAAMRERRVRRGFESDSEATPDFPPRFTFSSDFRSIVPAKPEVKVSSEPFAFSAH